MCRRLYGEPLLKAVPILLLTSREFEMDSAKLAGTNIRAVRDKPFSPRAILKLVDQLLT
jgi:CheY-like chemotaxis protein